MMKTNIVSFFFWLSRGFNSPGKQTAKHVNKVETTATTAAPGLCFVLLLLCARSRPRMLLPAVIVAALCAQTAAAQAW
jgi:glucan phosphoethanolaminetransferase (alkaline phosphatase superfamily)